MSASEIANRHFAAAIAEATAKAITQVGEAVRRPGGMEAARRLMAHDDLD